VSPGRSPAERRRSSQAGFTLIELLVATALGVVVLTALTSVVLTTYGADQTAVARTEVAGEIRNFQQDAYDDFASSVAPPTPSGCGTAAQPCTDSQITLVGCLPSTSYAVPSSKRTVSYQWSASTNTVVRQAGPGSVPAASNVTAFSWYVDTANDRPTVVVSITVQIKAINQSQTMRFYPRAVSQTPAYVTAAC
jgi:prepilin-type N-terminal cleavage/methylation domain-containing protein